MITVEKAQQEEEVIWEALVPALDEAVEKFVAMRTVEGENLKKDILLKGDRHQGACGRGEGTLPSGGCGISGKAE